MASTIAGHRRGEVGGGAGADRPLPRSQAETAADPEGTQPADPAAAREEEGARARARAAAGGKTAACHPGAQLPADPAPGANPRAHACLEEGRRHTVILISGATGEVKDRGQEAQEDDWYFFFLPLFIRDTILLLKFDI